GLTFCLLQGLLIGTVSYLCFPEHADATGREVPLVPRWVFPVALPLVALDAFVWGLLASAMCQSVLTAAGLAALFWLLGLLALVPCGMFHDAPLLPFVGRIALDVLMLCVSAAAFCQVDTLERETSTLVAPRRVRVAHSPGTWRVLLWLPLRQGW